MGSVLVENVVEVDEECSKVVGLLLGLVTGEFSIHTRKIEQSGPEKVSIVPVRGLC